MVASRVVARNDSDVRYFSALVVLGVFAIPAIGGACLFRPECPARLSECHEEEGQQEDPFCCDVLAVRLSKEQNLEPEPTSVLPAGWIEGPRSAEVPVEDWERLQASPPRSDITPLFILHSSYLL